MAGSYQCYADIDGDATKREHIEGAQNFNAGQEIIKHVKARVDPNTRVWGEFGSRQQGTKDFDFGRLKEEANMPNDGGEGTDTR